MFRLPIFPQQERSRDAPTRLTIRKRTSLAYSIGDQRPLVIRAGYGLFYTRIPQIYTSTVQSDNGLTPNFLFLNNNDFYSRQVFPQYPNPLVLCANAAECQTPSALTQLEQADVSAFSHNFKTPRVQQASLNIEREVAHRLAWASPTCTYTAWT